MAKALKWKSPEGYLLAAGGVLLLDGDGAWVVSEQGKYTDIGGRYDFNDGDIYATIAREFREELYNTAEISYFDLKNVPLSSKHYIDSFVGNPIYMCIVVNVSDIPLRGVLDNESVKRAKDEILRSNRYVPPHRYTTESLKLVPMSELRVASNVSPRLRSILEGL
uniref:Nudix hydrolase domain-containing protein n=1 Tax=viral metagenome TaxID=1070528 RepID=A0A6C0LYX4_9ZZZZ